MMGAEGGEMQGHDNSSVSRSEMYGLFWPRTAMALSTDMRRGAADLGGVDMEAGIGTWKWSRGHTEMSENADMRRTGRIQDMEPGELSAWHHVTKVPG